MKKNIVIITGEPNSINTEIIFKAIKKLKKNQKKRILLIGSYDILVKQLKILKKKIKIQKVESIEDFKKNNTIRIIDVPVKFSKVYSVDLNHTQKYIFKCLKIAHDLAIKRKIYGFINCPINKNIFKKKIGVTEYLSKLNNVLGKEVMMIYNKNFSVVPMTTHIDIKEIPKRLNKSYIFSKIISLTDNYKKIFKKKPTLAMLGLNPHNGEMRKKTEEKKFIVPAINTLKKKGVNIKGPFSVDEIFFNKKYEDFNIVVGMYHDQVLGPFKALFNFNAINITLGLKYLRISPDHGTAENIIFKNKSNPQSLISAINFIDEIK